MIFTASRGEAFQETFTFKNAQGRPLSIPLGDYRLTLERGDVVRVVPLQVTPSTIYWTMTAEQTRKLEYNTMYFTLSYNGQELSRGVLRVN
jgi:hypothetical protein